MLKIRKNSKQFSNSNFMAKSLLKVTVFGGVPPFSIKAQLFKGGEVVKSLDKAKSFEQLFDNLSGKYSLLISGPNPLSADRKTVIQLSTDEITLSADSDSSPTIRKGKAYLIHFHFITNIPL